MNAIDMNRPPARWRLKLWEIVLFSLILGVAATFIRGYFFGESDQLEQLPLIHRYLDPTFVTRDYSVNAMSAFSPRYYYVAFVGFLTHVFPLSTLFLLLTYVQHAAVALVTFLVSRRLFKFGDLPAILATVLVMAVEGPALGGAAHLVGNFLVPRTLMLFLALWCVWEGINLRPYWCALLSVIGSFIHPQVALQAGAIGLMTVGSTLVFNLSPQAFDGPSAKRRMWIRMFGAGAIVIIFNLLFWYMPMRGQGLSMESLLFVIQFRGPHLFLPSTFPLYQHLMAICFVVSMAIIWRWWYSDPVTDKELARRLGFAVVLLLLCLICGYVFVELLPMRFWMSAQAFRLMVFVKWLGLMLLGGTVARIIVQATTRRDYAAVPFYLTAVGEAQPALILLGSGIEFFRRKISTATSAAGFWPIAFAAYLMQLAVIAKVGGFRELLALLLYSGIAAGLIFLRQTVLKALLLVGGIAIIAFAMLINADTVRMPALKKIESKFTKNVGLDDPKNAPAIAQISEYALNHTADQSLFLTPPYFSKFRLQSRRAVIIDFKMVPFSEKDIQEWRHRMFDCYGTPHGSGWTALQEMQDNYRRIDDAALTRIAKTYGINYAVLYRTTTTSLPVLYENTDYKLVQVTVGD